MSSTLCTYRSFNRRESDLVNFRSGILFCQRYICGPNLFYINFDWNFPIYEWGFRYKYPFLLFPLKKWCLKGLPKTIFLFLTLSHLKPITQASHSFKGLIHGQWLLEGLKNKSMLSKLWSKYIPELWAIYWFLQLKYHKRERLNSSK